MAKQRLTETFSKDWKEPLSIKRLLLQESTKIVEANGKKYSVSEGFEVPVWRLGKKNLNGRTYNESLGQRMTKEFKEAITANLADHPNEDGSVNDILSVSKNPHIKEGILYVDSYIVDENFEKKLNKMIEAGYGLGVSSSVLGEVSDNGTVIDESVELERWFDWVLSPSYEVYVTEDCRISKEEDGDKKEIKNESIKENLTINNIKETNNFMSDKLKEMTEKNMRLNLNTILEHAENKTTITEKLAAFDEALTYTSEDFLPDVRSQILEKIEAIKKDSLMLAEQAKELPVLQEKVSTSEAEKTSIQEKYSILEKEKNELNEKYELATKLLDETKEYAQKAESLLELANAEKGSRFTADEYHSLLLKYEEVSDNYEKLLVEKEELDTKLSKIVKSYENKLNNLESEKEQLTEALADYTKDVEDGLMNEQVPEENNDYMMSDGETFDYSEYGQGVDDVDSDLDIYDSEVEDYYESLLDENPNYKVIKEDILKCKTLMEAQRTALRLSNLVEKSSGTQIKRPSAFTDTRLKESSKEPDVKNLKRKGWL